MIAGVEAPRFTPEPRLIALAACEYAGLGLPIFPLHALRRNGSCACTVRDCSDVGKHPASNGWQRTIASGHGAEATIWPVDAARERGIGLALGPRTGLWVLDVDPPHGGDESLAALEAEHGEISPSWESMTGGGGRHLFWPWPQDGGAAIRNSAGKVAPGLDVRGVGGFVVLPPSLHASGCRYRWARPPGSPPSPAPEWLVALVRSASARPARTDAAPADGDEVFARAGERHAQGVSLAGLMRWWGCGAETIVAAAITFRRTQCEGEPTPADLARVERQARDIARRYQPRRGT
jgi:hypothetical protein